MTLSAATPPFAIAPRRTRHAVVAALAVLADEQADVCNAGQCGGPFVCGGNASCTAATGGTACKCNPGYVGDGATCNDLNECTLWRFSCPSNTECQNKVGTYAFVCGTDHADCNKNKQTYGCKVQTGGSDTGNCGGSGTVCTTVNGQQLTCNAGNCGGGYAVANLNSGHKQFSFVFVTGGTTFNSNTEYASYCQSRGFDQNMNAASATAYTNAGMHNTSSYYCNAHCCYLDAGNSLWNIVSGFTNFGVPVGKPLRVFDRGSKG